MSGMASSKVRAHLGHANDALLLLAAGDVRLGDALFVFVGVFRLAAGAFFLGAAFLGVCFFADAAVGLDAVAVAVAVAVDAVVVVVVVAVNTGRATSESSSSSSSEATGMATTGA
jgi:hypothetical protein